MGYFCAFIPTFSASQESEVSVHVSSSAEKVFTTLPPLAASELTSHFSSSNDSEEAPYSDSPAVSSCPSDS